MKLKRRKRKLAFSCKIGLFKECGNWCLVHNEISSYYRHFYNGAPPLWRSRVEMRIIFPLPLWHEFKACCKCTKSSTFNGSAKQKGEGEWIQIEVSLFNNSNVNLNRMLDLNSRRNCVHFLANAAATSTNFQSSKSLYYSSSSLFGESCFRWLPSPCHSQFSQEWWKQSLSKEFVLLCWLNDCLAEPNKFVYNVNITKKASFQEKGVRKHIGVNTLWRLPIRHFIRISKLFSPTSLFRKLFHFIFARN